MFSSTILSISLNQYIWSISYIDFLSFGNTSRMENEIFARNYISYFRNMRQTLISYKWNRVFDCRQFQMFFTTVIYLNGFLYRSLYRHVVVNRKELNVSFIKETPQNLTRWSNEKTVLHFLLRKSRTTRHEWT